jgi:hypothetical protein
MSAALTKVSRSAFETQLSFFQRGQKDAVLFVDASVRLSRRRHTLTDVTVTFDAGADCVLLESFDAQGFRVDAPNDGDQFHVSMLRVPFGPWQLIRANSQRDV